MAGAWGIWINWQQQNILKRKPPDLYQYHKQVVCWKRILSIAKIPFSTLSNYSPFACRTLKCEIHLAIIQNEWLLLGTTIITDKISTGYHAEKWSTLTTPEMDKWGHINILCEARLFIHALTWAKPPLELQYIPRNMHTVFALLCFVVVIHWLIFPYPSGLLHWHCVNLTIAPVPAKQPWWIWINTSCEFIMNDCITTTKQSTTKPCAYFLGYTVDWCWFSWSLTLQQQRPWK